MLEVDRITKEYPSAEGPLRVLDAVSLRMHPGQRMVVMGPSGSGKSTLLSILGGLEKPTSGTVTLDGVDPFALTSDERASFRNSKIGFIFQEHHLMPGCTALDNVVLPALATGSVTRPIEERARWLLDRIGLSGRAEHPPSRLSGGERQRVAIARALLNAPPLILADEPTGQLDAHGAVAVAELLVEMAAESAAMLIVVTHAASIATRIAGRDSNALHDLVNGRLAPRHRGAALP